MGDSEEIAWLWIELNPAQTDERLRRLKEFVVTQKQSKHRDDAQKMIDDFANLPPGRPPAPELPGMLPPGGGTSQEMLEPKLLRQKRTINYLKRRL